jgi:hypothetical protein
VVLVFTEVVVVVDEVVAVDVVAVDVVVALLAVFPADVVAEPEAIVAQDERKAALTANGISQRALNFLMIETLFSLKVTLGDYVLLGKRQYHRQKKRFHSRKKKRKPHPYFSSGR